MDNSLTREELQKQLSESIAPLKVEECHFNDDLILVVRCKDCIHTEYPDRYARPEDKIVWCKRRSAYVPLKGFCSYGKEKE